jgi:hypothetical protein
VEERYFYFTAKHATMDDWRREICALFLLMGLRSVTLLKLPQTDIRNTEYVYDWEQDQNTRDWLNKQNMYMTGNRIRTHVTG